MEQKRQDQLIQELINLYWSTPTSDYPSQKGISNREWDEIVSIMLNKGFMEPTAGGTTGSYSITVEGRLYRNGRYIEEVSPRNDRRMSCYDKKTKNAKETRREIRFRDEKTKVPSESFLVWFCS